MTVLYVQYSGLDCLISGLDCLISGLDCLICAIADTERPGGMEARIAATAVSPSPLSNCARVFPSQEKPSPRFQLGETSRRFPPATRTAARRHPQLGETLLAAPSADAPPAGGFLLSARCRANMPHISQSWPHSGLGFQGKVLKTLPVVPSWLGSGACDCQE